MPIQPGLTPKEQKLIDSFNYDELLTHYDELNEHQHALIDEIGARLGRDVAADRKTAEDGTYGK